MCLQLLYATEHEHFSHDFHTGFTEVLAGVGQLLCAIVHEHFHHKFHTGFAEVLAGGGGGADFVCH